MCILVYTLVTITILAHRSRTIFKCVLFNNILKIYELQKFYTLL